MAQIKGPDRDFDPRHRIVGAIILVMLAVIILPLILDEHSSSAIATGDQAERSANSATVIAEASPSGGTAERQGKPSKVIIKKLSDDKSSTVATTAKPATDSGDTGTVKTVVKTVTLGSVPGSQEKRSTVVTASSPSPAKATAKKDLASLNPHWAVQVGTFSNPGNVRRLGEKLKQRGYSVMYKDVSLKQGTAVRVRVGPYASRASADHAQGKIVKDIGVKGVVVAGP